MCKLNDEHVEYGAVVGMPGKEHDPALHLPTSLYANRIAEIRWECPHCIDRPLHVNLDVFRTFPEVLLVAITRPEHTRQRMHLPLMMDATSWANKGRAPWPETVTFDKPPARFRLRSVIVFTQGDAQSSKLAHAIGHFRVYRFYPCKAETSCVVIVHANDSVCTMRKVKLVPDDPWIEDIETNIVMACYENISPRVPAAPSTAIMS